MFATEVEKQVSNNKILQDIIITGLMGTTLIVDTVVTDFFSDLSEIADIEDDQFLYARVAQPYANRILSDLAARHRCRVLLECKGGYISYDVTPSSEGLMLVATEAKKGAAMYAPTLDRSTLPHRFQKTRFVALATTNYSNALGKVGNTTMDAVAFLNSIQETEYRPVIIGRKCFEQIGGAAALPNRSILVLSSDPDYQPKGAFKIKSLADMMETLYIQFENVPRMYIVGGAFTFHTLQPIITDWRIVRHNVVDNQDHGLMNYHRLPNFSAVDWYASASRNYVDKATGDVCRIQNLRLRKADMPIIQEEVIDDEEKL